MTIVYNLPDVWDRLIPQEEGWKIDARTRSGGEGVFTRREQVVSSGLGRWIGRRRVRVRTRSQLLAARQLIALLDGRANAIMAGPCDCLNAPIFGPLVDGIPYSQPVYHSDGSGFQQGGEPSTTTGSASAGDFKVFIDPGDATRIEAGLYLGLNGYFYIITRIVSIHPVSGVIEAAIKPRLRNAVPIGTEVEWCKPRAPMRLANDDVGFLMVQLSKFGDFNIELEEYY